MILITGISGRVGSAAATHILAQKSQVRGFTRDRSKTEALENTGADIRLLEGDGGIPGGTFEDVEAVILVTGNHPQQKEQEINLARQAVIAGVARIIKISSLEVSPNTTAPFPKAHYEVEQEIARLPVQLQSLRPNFFMQNLWLFAAGIRHANTLSLPLGDAKTAMVNAAEVGVAAAEIALQPKHNESIYTLCGSDLCDFSEVARQLSRTLQRDIQYQPISLEAFHAMLSKAIPSAWHVDAVTALFAEIAAGSLEVSSPDLERLLGRAPSTISDFISSSEQVFAPA